MPKDLPVFRYHSDPVSTGSVVREDTTCDVCRLERSWRYAGPAYGRQRAPASICPWCIADGAAADKFDLEFIDAHGSGAVAPSVVDELTRRTPGYTAWQQEEWCFHCSDACDYLGPVGSKELRDLPDGVSSAVRAVLADWGRSDDERTELFEMLRRDGDLMAYLFRCLHCGEYVARCDSA